MSASLAANTHLVSSFPPFSSLPSALCSSGSLLQQSGDNVVRDVKELFVDLLVLTEIVIATGAGERRRTFDKEVRKQSARCTWKYYLVWLFWFFFYWVTRHNLRLSVFFQCFWWWTCCSSVTAYSLDMTKSYLLHNSTKNPLLWTHTHTSLL